MYEWGINHEIKCSLLPKPENVKGYGEKALYTPSKVVDTKACADKMEDIL